MKFSFAIALILCISIVGCKTNKKAEKSVVNTNFPGPPTIVYKMKKDYSKNVPVTLSADKLTIVNYPVIEDIMLNGQYPLPTLLKNGYYLDNRGIGPDVAFTKYTYEEYSKLTATPTIEELLAAIIDKDPIVVMYDCGNRLRFSNIETELNQLIESGDLVKKCKKLK
jgi:hypothetical protein